MSVLAGPGGMTYRGEWNRCEWGHGWHKGDCPRCKPIEHAMANNLCPKTTKAGDPCQGRPTATGLCIGHNKTEAAK